METYGWMLIKLDYSKIYYAKVDGAGMIEVPRHEVYTRGNKILLFRNPRMGERGGCICPKVVFEPDKYCWEDERMIEDKNKEV